MGWPWPFSSSQPSGNHAPSPPTDEISQRQGVALTDEQRIRIFGKPAPPAPTREEQADAELDALIKSFTAAEGSNATSEPTPGQSTSTAKSKEQIEETAAQQIERSRILPDGSLDISPSAMYPRTMSCRQAFDQAFYCQSLGGKFNDIYRYGHLQSCSEQWGAFWFCMRTRSLPDNQKEKQIRDHYAARDERKRKEFGSSEDVWEIRPVAVKRAFWKDPDADDDDGSGVRTTS